MEGYNEQMADVYQNQLTAEEFGWWSAAAKAHTEVSHLREPTPLTHHGQPVVFGRDAGALVPGPGGAPLQLPPGPSQGPGRPGRVGLACSSYHDSRPNDGTDVHLRISRVTIL